MLGEHPTIEIPQSSNYAKEMRKHEAHHSRYGAPGRPYVFREFPKLLYKCARVDGRIQVTEKFEVGDADQERNLNSRGFFELKKAYDVIEREQTEHGILAAEREYAIQHGKHSKKAVSEIRAAEAAVGSVHLPDVPETPISTHRKRGRKPKAAAAA